MSNFAILNNTHVIRGILFPRFQNVDFKKAIAEVIEQGDMATMQVVMRTMDNTNSSPSVSQTWDTAISETAYSLNQIQASVYNISSKYSYNPQESAKFSNATGESLPEVLEAIGEAGVANALHTGAFYGFDNSAEQGILSGATKVTLPQDSAGATTVTSYNPAEFVKFMNTIINQIRIKTFNAETPAVMFGTTEFITFIQTEIVNFLSSANSGGVNGIAGTVNMARSWAGENGLEFYIDDSLKGKGTAGKDAFFIMATKTKNDELYQRFNQNIGIAHSDGTLNNTIMVLPVANISYPNPAIDGVISTYNYMSSTSGWNIRPECISLITYDF